MANPFYFKKIKFLPFLNKTIYKKFELLYIWLQKVNEEKSKGTKYWSWWELLVSFLQGTPKKQAVQQSIELVRCKVKMSRGWKIIYYQAWIMATPLLTMVVDRWNERLCGWRWRSESKVEDTKMARGGGTMGAKGDPGPSHVLQFFFYTTNIHVGYSQYCIM